MIGAEKAHRGAVRMGSTGRWPVAFGGSPNASKLHLALND
jgi:hypothetical protein